MIYITEYDNMPRIGIEHNAVFQEFLESAYIFRIDHPIGDWYDEEADDLESAIHNGVKTWMIMQTKSNALTINKHGVVEFH